MEELGRSQIEIARNVEEEADMSRVHDSLNGPGHDPVAAAHDLNVWIAEANAIVERCKQRGGAYPRLFDASRGLATEEQTIEHNDSRKLMDWSKIENGLSQCPQQVQSFLDAAMPHWRSLHQTVQVSNSGQTQVEDPHVIRMRRAHEIVTKYKSRGATLPRQFNTAPDDPELQQEHKDALQLFEWKEEIDKHRLTVVSVSVEKPQDDLLVRQFMALGDYLDLEIRGWRDASLATTSTANTPLEKAREIYNRYVARSCQLPQQIRNPGSMEKEQENRDAIMLHEWSQSLPPSRKPMGQNQSQSQSSSQGECPEDVGTFLDEHIPQWREKLEKQLIFNQKAMMFAEGIVARYEARGNVMPVRSKECKADLTRVQEYRDAAKLNDWKQSLRGNKTKTVCCDDVKAFLDEKLPLWRDMVKETHNDPMAKAIDIVQRYRERGHIMPREWREHHLDPVRAEEYKDASKLRNWKRALKGNGTHNCPDAVRDFLDTEMPNWRKDVRKQYTNPMITAREIVERYNLRGKQLPRHFSSNRKDPDRQQEYKDAKKLYDWKQGLKGLRFYRCSPQLKEYLDENLPGWNDGVYSKASLLAEAEKSKGATAAKGGGEGQGLKKAGGIDDDEEKVVSVSLPAPVTMPVGMAMNQGQGVGDGAGMVDMGGNMHETAKKRLREEASMDQVVGVEIHQHQHHLDQQQMHAQHQQQHQQQQQQMLDPQQQHLHEQQQMQMQMHDQQHLLLPPAKVPRVMETKEV